MVKRITLIVSILGATLSLIAVSVQSLTAATDVPADPGVMSAVIPLGSIKDNTLYEESDSLSNGKGEYFFAGSIVGGDRRRGLLKFDIASNVPPQAIIISATLRLNVSRHPQLHKPESFSIHRLMTDWGEGTSDALEPGGSGAAATEGDATWSFSYYSPTPTGRIAWITPGGDFAPAASATTIIDEQGLFYTWGPSPGILTDLMYWLRAPEKNYGWIVLGNESEDQTARRFDSRENGVPANRPTLKLEYVQAKRSYLPVIIGR